MPAPPCLVTFAVPGESRAFRPLPGTHLLHTGIGAEAAADALRVALAQAQPAWVLASGFAGGLDPALRAGEVFAADNLSAPELLARVPATLRRAALHSAPHAAQTPEEKARLHQATGAAAVDMETAALAAVCTEAAVPLLAVRIISDAHDEPLPLPLPVAWDFQTQRPRPAAIARHLLRHPPAALRLGRFLFRLPSLQRRLATVLRKILEPEAQPKR
jgi:nucleoside phosphorylase